MSSTLYLHIPKRNLYGEVNHVIENHEYPSHSLMEESYIEPDRSSDCCHWINEVEEEETVNQI